MLHKHTSFIKCQLYLLPTRHKNTDIWGGTLIGARQNDSLLFYEA